MTEKTTKPEEHHYCSEHSRVTSMIVAGKAKRFVPYRDIDSACDKAGIE